MSATPASLWHVERQKRILHDHPEVRKLQGHFRGSAVLIVALNLWQIGLAYAARRSGSWTFSILLGYCVGSIGCHTLGVLIHECAHNLVAKGTPANKVWAIVANFTLGAPGAIEFRVHHLLHHKFLGEVDGRDTQAPTRKEAATVRSPLAKLASFAFGRFYFPQRPESKIRWDSWVIANWIVMGFSWAFFITCIGGKGILCLTMAAVAAFGPHALGARRLSEHFAFSPDQPTVSYYGPWNRLTLDVGYHVEHHDIPSIPWIHMRKLRAIAHEHYDGLWSFRSWWRLLWDYFTKYRVDHYFGMGSFVDDPLEVKSLQPPITPPPAERAARASGIPPRQGSRDAA